MVIVIDHVSILIFGARGFQEWVQQMMWQLHNSSPRFILCVVPSKFLSTNSFEERFVLQQLRLNRVTEAVKALRTGCIEQIAHQFFASRYVCFKCILPMLKLCLGFRVYFTLKSKLYFTYFISIFLYPNTTQIWYSACT